MSDHGILFNRAMVQALMDGRKTQTRRTAAPRWKVGDRLWVRETHWRYGSWRKNGLTESGRQKWRFQAASDEHRIWYAAESGVAQPLYAGRGDRKALVYWKRPSLFMERRHSRLTLTVTEIRHEALLDISDADCLAEGILREEIEQLPGHTMTAFTYEKGGVAFRSPLYAYLCLWDLINGEAAAAQNPMVYATTFEVRKGNIDA